MVGADLADDDIAARVDLELTLRLSAAGRWAALSVAACLGLAGTVLGEQPLRLGQHDDDSAAVAQAAMPHRKGRTVPSNAWPMTQPIKRARHGTDNALNRRGGAGDRAICSIASVLRLDDVNAKQTIARLWKTMNDRQLSAPSGRDRCVNAGDQRESRASRCARPAAGRSGLRSAHWSRSQPPSAPQWLRIPGRWISGALERVEDDLLDRGDVGDERRRTLAVSASV